MKFNELGHVGLAKPVVLWICLLLSLCLSFWTSHLNVPLVVVSGLMVGMGYAIYSLSDCSNEDYSQCRLHIFANILVGILMVVL